VADSRTGTRFPVHLPIKVLGTSAAKPELEGTTENISGAGVYIWVDQTLEVNSRVEFEITIPAPAIGADQDVVLHCVGRVIRADSQSSEKSGVACVIDEYDFVRREAGS
jgi:c-di-GMP-binding flagellar brake protein YcgR